MITPNEKSARAAALGDARNRERFERYESALHEIANMESGSRGAYGKFVRAVHIAKKAVGHDHD